MKPNQPTHEDYDKRYLAWKGWGKQKPFGHLAAHTKACYDAEIRATHLKKIENVLEIGFGNGGFLGYAKRRGWDITGSEISTELLEVAQNAGYKTIEASDVARLPTQSFDLIVAFDVFEHIPADQIEEFIHTLRDKLREGGILLARFPNGDSPLGLPYQNGDITHTQAIGSNKVRYLAGQTQMDIVRLSGEIIPLFSTCLPLFFYALATNPLRWLAGIYQKIVYFPNKRFVLNSPNLVVALRRPAGM